ncbi:MAG: SLC13 family permease [Gammaproteobacteria bacterium]|nr:MAG: SLC13 family permease [Gammaproteobacteria bacterium]
MNPDQIIVLTILVAALLLFISEAIRMDLVALLVLAALAITGLVSTGEAFSGFSNNAVVTVWAMFILSDGLTRTGIATILGQQVMRIAGRREIPLMIVIMLSCGSLSFFMNNIGVAALMLPVVMDISRRTETPPSILLMPMAFGTLLGGLTTLVGTPPNLLISGALAQAGYTPFGLFDYFGVGAGAMVAGILFIALVGRLILPRKDPTAKSQRSQRNLRAQYGLQESTFVLTVPRGSVLIGKSLAESRLGAAAGLLVMALERNGQVETLPARTTVLRPGDRLLVQGRIARFEELRRWGELVLEREAPVTETLLKARIQLVEATVAEDSALVKEPVSQAEFRRKYRASVVALRRDEQVRRANLGRVPLRAGDVLLLQISEDAVDSLAKSPDFASVEPVTEADLLRTYHLQERIFVLRVPEEWALGGSTLAGSRLSDVFDFRLLGIFRGGELEMMPDPEAEICAGDLLLIQGQPEDLDLLRGLRELEIGQVIPRTLELFESDRLAMVEATLAPQSPLAGQLVSDVNFREKYGLELVAILRSGKTIRSDIGRRKLQFGDGLLFVGPRQRLQRLSEDPELLVITPVSGSPAADTRLAPLAAAIMLGVIGVVLAGLLPISVAAVAGAAIMVLTGCLSMEDAYRAIDWRAVFLIAGMLPLGIAMEGTGTAAMLANKVMGLLGDYGPWPVIMGLYGVTALATMIIPTAALVVLMSPIVLSACGELGIMPHTAMMAVAMAASASFTSPISHPANILIMGPGGYRFADYIKLGVPLTLIVFGAVMLLLPVFWPLTPVDAAVATGP